MKGQDIMIYVGIDVASQKHDCFLLRDTGEVFSKTSFTIKNDFEGYKKLHNSILQFVESTKDSNVRIGLESTGHYSKNILLVININTFFIYLYTFIILYYWKTFLLSVIIS